MAYITTPLARGKWKTNAKISGFPSFLWEAGAVKWDDGGKGTDAGLVNGYRAFATNQLSSFTINAGTGAGAATNGCIFGNFNDLIIANWAGIDVVTDPYTAAATGEIVVTIHLMCDIGVRRPRSFCVCNRFSRSITIRKVNFMNGKNLRQAQRELKRRSTVKFLLQEQGRSPEAGLFLSQFKQQQQEGLIASMLTGFSFLALIPSNAGGSTVTGTAAFGREHYRKALHPVLDWNRWRRHNLLPVAIMRFRRRQPGERRIRIRNSGRYWSVRGRHGVFY